MDHKLIACTFVEKGNRIYQSDYKGPGFGRAIRCKRVKFGAFRKGTTFSFSPQERMSSPGIRKIHLSREPGNRTIKLSNIYISAEGPQAAFSPKKAIRRSPRIRGTLLNSLIIVANIANCFDIPKLLFSSYKPTQYSCPPEAMCYLPLLRVTLKMSG